MIQSSRFIILFVSNLLLFQLLQLVNQTLEIHGLTLYLDGLFLFMPAMVLRLRWALIQVAFLALWADASLPITFGFHLVLWSIATTALFYSRQGLRRVSRFHQSLACLLVTVVLLLLQGVILGGPYLLNPAYWQRLLADLVLSILLFFPVAYWFLSFEGSILYFFGCNLSLDVQSDDRQ